MVDYVWGPLLYLETGLRMHFSNQHLTLSYQHIFPSLKWWRRICLMIFTKGYSYRRSWGIDRELSDFQIKHAFWCQNKMNWHTEYETGWKGNKLLKSSASFLHILSAMSCKVWIIQCFIWINFCIQFKIKFEHQ